ncbi:malonate--CoA ligase [Piscinibacter gummiphilus]|uniref:Malonyl-CoA synthase n=1 Tax=Piscinibacter gummiphilus TaxID=946333 RepID=A0A1W6LFB8_9BURK|nr:malonyl-CoA synthase [Piscinibacter gummiphilus]ARN22955.1 malonyl-CoA synthase [Piscinibacter gummiphilus]ATU67656.1 malonyl-CoA synthase [Piscinibacter gummiphilus]GLS96786.1 malonyl-CoA synthetase [Piscinibacter gummiphilus]
MTANDNLFVALRDAFPSDRDRVAIETTGDTPLYYRWNDLDRATARIANLLQGLDLPAGSRVAAHVDKSVEALMLYLAVLRAGFTYLPLNPAYKAGELGHFIQDAEPAVVVCAGANFGWVSKLAFTSGVAHVFTLNTDRTGSLLERASFQPDTHEPAVRAASDLAVILYTSGTTGRSKGAMLTHGNMLSNARTLKEYWAWQPDDVLVHALPIFHIHGLFVACHGALLNGSRMIWFDRFEPGPVRARFADATVFMGVPTMYVRLLADPALTPEACRAMRLFVSGSAPLLAETFREWQARTGHTILERYGMSETVMQTSNPYEGERRAGTVGHPLPGVDLRIASPDADSGNGGIEVRGPNVFAGYWRLPEKTKEEFTADGWFRTGDVGRFDSDGYLHIVGRAKDLVISGGFNVYPAEVEATIDELPGVAESAVIGVPHPDFGEAVVAVLVPRAGATLDGDTIVNAVKTRLAGFKVPKRVFVVDELPRNAMGKVQKKALRDQHQHLFKA